MPQKYDDTPHQRHECHDGREPRRAAAAPPLALLTLMRHLGEPKAHECRVARTGRRLSGCG